METTQQKSMAGFYGQPWAVLEPYLFEMEAALRSGVAPTSAASREGSTRSRGKIAVLPLMGPIFHRGNLFTRFFGGVNLEEFRRMFGMMAADPEIESIVLEVDSPGGGVFGMPEMAQRIFEARKRKPVVAVVNALGASAAYWLASAASTLVVTPSGMVGSIGVYGLHLDFSGQMAMAGIKPTFISAGKFKTEGNELEPLGDVAANAIQRQVNEVYGAFVRDVARFRGVGVDRVRNGFGEGRVVSAREALREGMVDAVATMDEVLVGLATGRGPRTAQQAARAWDAAGTLMQVHCGADAKRAFATLRAKSEAGSPGVEAVYTTFELAMQLEGKRREHFAWLAVDEALGKRQPGALKKALGQQRETQLATERISLEALL